MIETPAGTRPRIHSTALRYVSAAADEAAGDKTASTDTKSAARALELFRLFAVARRALTLTEISEQLDAPKSSCFQLVRTLQNMGYLYALGPRKGYYPTKLIVQLGQTIAQHDPLLQLIAPQLLQAREQTMESIVVASLHEGTAMIVDLLESPQGIRFTARIGERRPLVSSSIGKALLGAMTREERAEVLGKPKSGKGAKSAPVDLVALEKEMAAGTRRGWYVSKDEPLGGVTAVAIPLNVAGTRLTVAVAGPTPRVAPKIAQHAAVLLECFATH